MLKKIFYATTLGALISYQVPTCAMEKNLPGPLMQKIFEKAIVPTNPSEGVDLKTYLNINLVCKKWHQILENDFKQGKHFIHKQMLQHSYEHLIFNPSLDIHNTKKSFLQEDFLCFFLYHNGDKDIFNQYFDEKTHMPSIKVFQNKALFINVIRDFKLKDLNDILFHNQICMKTFACINVDNIAKRIGLFKKDIRKNGFLIEGPFFIIYSSDDIHLEEFAEDDLLYKWREGRIHMESRVERRVENRKYQLK